MFADPAFLSALVVFTLIVISPGPAVLAIMATGMAEGRTKALALTAGILCGSSFWGMVAAFGFASMLDIIGQALVILKIIGGFYLLYLARKAWLNGLSSEEPKPMRVESVDGLKGYFLTGLLIHLTNPKAVFGWIATITVGISVGSSQWEAFALVLVCLSIVAALKGCMALFFSTPKLMAGYRKARRAIQFTFAGFFTFAGVRLILNR